MSSSGHEATLAARLLDFTLANPIDPSWSLHFKTVGKFCVPLRAVHAADQLQLRRIDKSTGTVEYKPILDISVNDLTCDYRLIWTK